MSGYPDLIKRRDIKHRWTEPFFMMVRLQGEVGRRLIFSLTILVSVFLASNFLVLLSSRSSPFDALNFASAITITGGLLICFFVFAKSKRPSGNVVMTEQKLRLEHYLPGFFYNEQRWQEWPYAALVQCGVVTPDKVGHNFGILVLVGVNKTEIIGVPRSVDIRVIANFLASRGVSVAALNRLPQSVILEPALTPLKMMIAFVVAAAFGFVVLVQMIIKLVH